MSETLDQAVVMGKAIGMSGNWTWGFSEERGRSVAVLRIIMSTPRGTGQVILIAMREECFSRVTCVVYNDHYSCQAKCMLQVNLG